MERAEVLARAVETCRRLLPMFLGGFTDDNRTAQAPGLPNHAAWTLGHSATTFHEIAHHLDAGPMLPARDFASDGPDAAPPLRFRADDLAFGSTPVDDPARYPQLARCVEIYGASCDRLTAALRAAPDADLDREVPWGEHTQSIFQCTLSMTFHAGYHTGQLADLRRALGMPPLFGSGGGG